MFEIKMREWSKWIGHLGLDVAHGHLRLNLVGEQSQGKQKQRDENFQHFHHRAILLEATSYIHVIRKLWESWPTRVGSNIVTSVNSHKYILLMYQKNVWLKRKKEKFCIL